MILAVNIGNTNIRAAIGKKEPELDAVAWGDEVASGDSLTRFIEERFGPDLWDKLEGSILASVVPSQTPLVSGAIQAKTGTAPQRIDIKGCMSLNLKRYKGLPGEDRVVCCVGALQKYQPPFILVDFGTATTVNAVTEDRAFIGGAILAGLHISLKALADRTAQLPLIIPVKAKSDARVPLIGTGTEENLLSGAVLGQAFAVEGYVNRIKSQLGPQTKVIVTGGHAPVVLPCCNFEYIHEPNLLLCGLFSLFRRGSA